MPKQLNHIAQQFCGADKIFTINPLGNGLINDSYLVTTSHRQFVLQRINHQVFPEPSKIMANLQQISHYLSQLPPETLSLQIPTILVTSKQQSHFLDQEQNYWRALQYIQPSESREQISNHAEAEQVGFALGHFHRLLSALPINSLYDTLPGFHITPQYFSDYQALLNQGLTKDDNAEMQFCLTFIQNYQQQIYELELAKLQGKLQERVIHGDPKLNNFLFQPGTDQIISLIDLDTVKPGLIHYDLGDCLRSCCHDLSNNQFDLDRAEIILNSYLQQANPFLTKADYYYLLPAIELIPFELGLRFFSDYLAGNIYFKVTDSQQNLHRALALFELVSDIGRKNPKLEKILAGLAKR